MITAFALERTVHFFTEKQIELYEVYYSGVSQVKNVMGAKNGFQGRTCFGLERRGA